MTEMTTTDHARAAAEEVWDITRPSKRPLFVSLVAAIIARHIKAAQTERETALVKAASEPIEWGRWKCFADELDAVANTLEDMVPQHRVDIAHLREKAEAFRFALAAYPAPPGEQGGGETGATP